MSSSTWSLSGAVDGLGLPPPWASDRLESLNELPLGGATLGVATLLLRDAKVGEGVEGTVVRTLAGLLAVFGAH